MKKMYTAILTLLVTVISMPSIAQVTLSADGPGNTYSLIESKGFGVENPDCQHSSFGPHVTEVFDNTLNKYVFVFHSHHLLDNDRCTNEDRTRMEIKGGSGSPADLQHTSGQIAFYRWKFRLDAGFKPSSRFTHIFQIKAIDGDDGAPLITITPRAGSPEKMQIIHSTGSGSGGLGTVTQVDLAPFKGQWVEAYVKYKSAEGSAGTFEIILKRLSDGATLLSYSNNSLDMWRTDASYNRPKWGVYRGKDDALRDEEVRFADFCITESSASLCPSDIGTPPPACTPVTASSDDGNIPDNVLDNDLNTRWSATGDGQWIQFCLANPTPVSGVQIAFYNGNSRTSTFDVLVGNDGLNWTNAATGRVSSGSTTALETFTFTPVTGKYIRIVGHGNSVNAWNSYTEVKIQTGSGGSQTFILNPEADAYVRDGSNAATTHGTTDAGLLITKLSPSGQLNNARESYLRFNAASVSGTITSATLRVYGKIDLTTTPSVPIGVYAVSNITWSESTLTWNNKPPTGTGLDTSTVTNTAYAYIPFDVTAYLQAELTAGRSKVSFAMKSLTAHDPRVFWNSREAGSNLPQLVVTTGPQESGAPDTHRETLMIETGRDKKKEMSVRMLPNPFRNGGIIEFHLPEAGQTSLVVYDITGRQVAQPVNGVLQAGNHRVPFAQPGNGGVFIVKLVHKGKSITTKIRQE
ncbi:MAG: CBM96 family carbohydrate-binding protein [Pseudobacter sp.]|uniref:CBM96 family carbohydrate-binding protein n=1 Tax=Pseudobacter sp. TaxID=2045420 RepID=UPI003F7E93A5